MKTDRLQGIMPKQPKPLKIQDIRPRANYKHVKLIVAELPVQNQNLYSGHGSSSNQATGQKTTNPIVEELARRLKIDTQ